MASTYSISLHGLINDAQTPHLKEKLRGLCNLEARDFALHEIACAPTNAPVISIVRTDDVLVRLQRYVDAKDDNSWSVLLLGHPEPRRNNIQATVRPIVQTPLKTGSETHTSALNFMNLLGFSFAFELLKKGVEYTYAVETSQVQAQGQRPLVSFPIKISISKVYTLPTRHDLSVTEAVEASSLVSLVEATITGISAQESVSRAVEQLKNLRAVLKGTVDLTIVDPLSLQNKLPTRH